MNIPALLAECRALNVHVTARGGRLHVKAAKGVLSAALSANLKESKLAIINYLSSQSGEFQQARPPRPPTLPEGGCGNLEKSNLKTEECQPDPVGNLGGLGDLQNEEYEERAAIIEYEGGHNRTTAEVLAKACCTDSVIELWAYITPEGRVLADSEFKSESDAWRIGLGWPDDSEIIAAKAAGARVERVSVIRDKSCA